jgi:NAD(P)-dependent dehydrogenase (short-subunit alcohol dehydrogenase family)
MLERPAMLTERHVLVTGGAGFIGSQLCKRLLATGQEIRTPAARQSKAFGCNSQTAEAGVGINKIGRKLGIGVSVVQRIVGA